MYNYLNTKIMFMQTLEKENR